VLDQGQIKQQTVEGFVEDFMDSSYDQRWKYYVGIVAVAVFFQITAQVLATNVSFLKR